MSVERARTEMATIDSRTQTCCDMHLHISHQRHLQILLSTLIADGI